MKWAEHGQVGRFVSVMIPLTGRAEWGSGWRPEAGGFGLSAAEEEMLRVRHGAEGESRLIISEFVFLGPAPRKSSLISLTLLQGLYSASGLGSSISGQNLTL